MYTHYLKSRHAGPGFLRLRNFENERLSFVTSARHFHPTLAKDEDSARFVTLHSDQRALGVQSDLHEFVESLACRF